MFEAWPDQPWQTALVVAAMGAVTWGSFLLHVLLHEGAHALVARLVGFRVLMVLVGAGPLVLRLPCGDGCFELRLLPRHGMVAAATASARWFRTRFIALVLAGPLTDLAFVAVLLSAGVAASSMTAAAHWTAPLPALCFALTLLHFLTMLTSWVPRATSLGAPSDTLRCLQLLRLDAAAVRATVTEHQVQLASHAAWRCLARGDAAAALQLWDQGVACTEHAVCLGRSVFVWATAGAEAALQAVATERDSIERFALAGAAATNGPLPSRLRQVEELRAVLDTNEAFFMVETGRADLLPLAQRLIERAVAVQPDEPSIVRTQALVRLHQGDIEGARTDLQWVWRQQEPRWLRALTACYLAYAHARAGSPQRAQAFLERARRLDPHCRLLTRYAQLAATAVPIA